MVEGSLSLYLFGCRLQTVWRAVWGFNPNSQSAGILLATMKFDSDNKIWKWVMEQRSFCVGLVRSWGFSQEDAEEIFSDLLLKWVKKAAGNEFPDEIQRGFLIHNLRQVKNDFWQRREALKRGRGVDHVPFDEFSGPESLWRIDEQADGRAALPMIDRLRVRTKGRKQLLLVVIRRAIVTGESVTSWADAFTVEERRKFMGEADRKGKDGTRRFAKQVSRTFSEILREIERINQSN